MRRSLFSELRTIYETSASKPNTFRQTIKLRDLVDGEILRKAVNTAMKRYPYFCVRLVIEGNVPFFEDNPSPVPVIHTNHQTVLGSEQTSGHLLCFCYWKNKLHIDAYHGLTDGGGIAPLVKTLLYYYCSEFYETELSDDGLRLSDDEIPQAEWDDPAAIPLAPGKRGLVQKWNQPAFQLANAGIANITADGIVINMRIPERTFMEFNISNDGSPATIVALLLARTIEALHPDKSLPTVIGMCVNQRKALRAPLAHQSLVGDVRLAFTNRIKKLPFSTQATCFRGMVTLQSDNDMVLDEQAGDGSRCENRQDGERLRNAHLNFAVGKRRQNDSQHHIYGRNRSCAGYKGRPNPPIFPNTLLQTFHDSSNRLLYNNYRPAHLVRISYQ